MDKKLIAEHAYDIQIGLGRSDAPEFDGIRTIGMAASLAVHLRGLGEIPFEVLRKVSDHFFNIPSYALRSVLDVLAELEFVDLITIGARVEKIIPTVPQFKDVYSILGTHPHLDALNEHEQAALHILGALQLHPENRDRLLQSSQMEKQVFDRCIVIGNEGGLVREHRVRGRNILVSPVYFADNAEGLADLAVQAGSAEIKNTLDIIRKNQGWPLSLTLAQNEIGGYSLTATQISLVECLSAEGILRPPTIQFSAREESFLFSPRPGNIRLDAANREIYERAMALVASVRKGQLLPDSYKIKWPVSILRSLRDKGYLGSNSDAAAQYGNLCVMRVGYLKETQPGRWQFYLHRTEENIAALTLAIQLLETGELANMELNQEARLALSKDERYIQSVISSAEMRRREKKKVDAQAAHEFEQMILQFDR
ncbi:hypothetical protein SAMN05518865_103124 [Duganella sp. CF458]|uniref:hypothetical protein n=1 Tax=Duganella sp. CF458 TaxID=1884368 RepID=UPI0008F0E3C8|nr:hypothetical protein [Duganella sp. CF458]SFF68070.1 hypothetical protein SAMN05518865_103124 [Duganella sp. CF458]